MSEVKQCPNCGQIAAHVMTVLDAGKQKRRTVCSNCGWNGPGCYGEKCDPNDPICAGGNDKTYWDATKQTHQRPQCGVYSPCSSEKTRLETHRFVPMIQPQTQIPIAQNLQVPQPPQTALTKPPTVTLPMVDGSKKVVAAPQMPPIPQHIPVPVRSVPVKPMAPPQQYQQQYQQYQQYQPPVPQVQLGQAPQGGMQPYVLYQQHNGQPIVVQMVPPMQASSPSLVPQNMVQPGTQVMQVICVPEPEQVSYPKRFFGSVGRAMLKHGFMQAANMMDHVPWWG